MFRKPNTGRCDAGDLVSLHEGNAGAIDEGELSAAPDLPSGLEIIFGESCDTRASLAQPLAEPVGKLGTEVRFKQLLGLREHVIGEGPALGAL